jgi:hypothetical protein
MIVGGIAARIISGHNTAGEESLSGSAARPTLTILAPRLTCALAKTRTASLVAA